MKDGSLLVSDDWNGAVYRITYGKQNVGQPVTRSKGRGRWPPAFSCQAAIMRIER